MALFGTNLKLTIDKQHRPRVHSLFVEVLGATPKQPMPQLEQYLLADGGSVGAFYVEGSEALSDADQRKGAWLEFRVDDPDRVAAKIEGLGIERLEYRLRPCLPPAVGSRRTNEY